MKIAKAIIFTIFLIARLEQKKAVVLLNGVKVSEMPTQSFGYFLAREFMLNLQFNFKAHYSQVARGRKWYSRAHLLQYPRHFLFQTND